MSAPLRPSRIWKQALLYGVGLWGGRLAGFALIPLYTRWVGMAEFGVYELLSRMLDVLAVLLPLGMVVALVRFYGLAPAGERRLVASTSILWVAGLGGLCTALLWPLRNHVAAWLVGTPVYGGAVALVGLWVWFELLFSASCALLRARQQVGLHTTVNLARSVLAVSTNIYLVWHLRLGLPGILLANVLACGAAAVSLTAYALSVEGVSFSRRWCVKLLTFGAPLALSAILATIAVSADRYLINRYLGPQPVAVFGIGARLATLLAIGVFAPFGLAYYPFVFNTVKQTGAGKAYARILTQMALAGAGFTVVLVLFAPEVIALLAPETYRGAIRCGQIYLIGALLYGLSAQVEVGIYVHGATIWKPLSFCSMAAMSIMLNLLLVPRYGLTGAALAYVGSQASYISVLYLISRRMYSIPYEWVPLLAVALGFAVCWFAASAATSGSEHLLSLPGRVAAVALAVAGISGVRVMAGVPRARIRDLAAHNAASTASAARAGRPLRILQVVSAARAWGGVETYVIAVARELSRRGHQVSLACPPGSWVAGKATDAGLTVIPARVDRDRQWTRIPGLIHAIHQGRFDVVHLHHPEDWRIGCLAARLARAPALIGTRHACLGCSRRVVGWLYSHLLFDAIIAVSEAVRTELVATGADPRRITVVRNGVDVRAFRPDPSERLSVRRELEVSDHTFVIGCVGRVSEGKGHNHLIAAVAGLPEDADLLCLVVGGGPAYIPRLQAQAADMGVSRFTRFLGFREDIGRIMNGIDLLVVPSAQPEGLCLAALEAMATAKPVIAAGHGGVTEVVSDRVTGFLYMPGDDQALGELLRLCLADRGMCLGMGSAARRRAESLFTIEGCVSQIEEIYGHVLAPRASEAVVAQELARAGRADLP